MHWLIWGAKGYVGQQLTKYLRDHKHQVTEAKSRADDPKTVTEELQDVKPDRVFSCVGRTHGASCNSIDYLESPGKLFVNIRDNLWAPIVLASACQAAHVHYTYLGTGCIFSDTSASSLYTPESEPNFFGSQYSTVKGFTDKYFHLPDVAASCLNLRIRMPISDVPHPRNLVDKLAKYPHVIDIPNSVSVLPTLWPAMVQMVRERRTGTVNFVNPGTMRHPDFLLEYNRIVDPDHTFETWTLEEQERHLAAQRSNTTLDSQVMRDLGVPDVKDAVTTTLVAYQKNIRDQHTRHYLNVLLCNNDK